MTQDDQQPERAPGGRISRDTLLLLGALTFLIIAVALTFLFTPGSGPREEAAAEATPTIAAIATAPADPYPAPPTAEAPTDPYPAPPTDLPALPTEAPPLSPSPDLIATGDPALEPSPTPQDVAGGLQPTVPPLGGYPAPVGEGTPPAAPTIGMTVVVPTVAAAPTFAPPPTIAPPTAALPPTIAPPTADLPPTIAPPTVAAPAPEATSPPVAASEAPPTATAGPPPPPPADVLRGNVRWSPAQGPIILRRDVQIAPGAELLIEPGVEVRLDPGVSIYVDGGRLLALGLPGQPVRFVGTGARWSGIFGRPNSFVVLEHTEVRGGGAGGTVMAVDRSELVIRGSRFNDNGGSILLTDTRLEMRDSEVAGNDMPFGAALEATYGRGTFVTLRGNRFGGNRLSEGAPQVRITNSSTFETLNLDIEANLLRGGTPNLQLDTNGPIRGTILCNTLVNEGQGFGLRTQTVQVNPNGRPPFDLRVEQNYIDDHVPPIIPVYLRFGLGRGATSEVMLDMRNNWWGDASGPYEPDANANGRGDSVGSNIIFAPWLREPPPCTPR